MARSKRRKSAWLPFAMPVHSDWKPQVGDRVSSFSPAGDPRVRSTSLKAAYIVPERMPIGPVLLSDFINVDGISDEQASSLQAILGVSLSQEARNHIDAAIHRMVTTIALAARIPGWGAFRDRLHAIIRSGNDCIKAAQQFVQMIDPRLGEKEKPKGTLSLDRAVKTYLSLKVFGDSIVDIRIDAILTACEQGLEEVGPRASKTGPKSNALWRFLHSIETAAKGSGGPTTLPPDSIRETPGPEMTTPLFEFGRECLKIAIANGKVGIAKASLSDSEKVQAERTLSRLGRYTKGDQRANGALLSRWRDARTRAKAEETAV